MGSCGVVRIRCRLRWWVRVSVSGSVWVGFAVVYDGGYEFQFELGWFSIRCRFRWRVQGSVGSVGHVYISQLVSYLVSWVID